MRQATLYVDEPHLRGVVDILEAGIEYHDEYGIPLSPSLVADLERWIAGIKVAFPNSFPEDDG